MLKYRLIFGPLMIAALLGVFYLDNRLDQVPLNNNFWEMLGLDRGFGVRLFLGRDYLPAGLIMLLVFVTIIILGAGEFCAIARAKGIPATRFMITLAGLTGCVLIYIVPNAVNSQVTVAFVATLMAVLFIASQVHHSWMNRRTEGAVAVGGLTMLAFVYLGLLPGFYVAIRRWHSAWIVLAIILITKCCDIGAYFTGRAIGRHKLIPWLSPGKTWEGLAGGVLLSMLVAAGLAWISNEFNDDAVKRGAHVLVKQGVARAWVPLQFDLVPVAIAGALIALVGQFGDLTASLFKRDAGIKDSGQSIPGFGGFLDVVDSPIVVAPLAYWLLWWAANRGNVQEIFTRWLGG
jgi:phosphatidate cytidylyltransferase